MRTGSLYFILAMLGAAASCLGAGDRQYGNWHSSRIDGGGYLQHAVFAPSEPQRLYLSSDVGGLFRSDDGGNTWRMLHDSLPASADNYSVSGVLVNPLDADNVLIATDSGIWLSRDGGKSWKQTLQARFAGNGPYRADGRVLVATPGNPERVLAAPLGTASEGTRVYLSTDGGSTWTPSAPVGGALKAEQPTLYPVDLLVDQSDPSRIWLSARKARFWTTSGQQAFGGGLYRSDDSGKSWQKLSGIGMKEIIQVPPLPAESQAAGALPVAVTPAASATAALPLLALAPTTDRVVLSTDLGQSWQPLDKGLASYSTHYRRDGAYGALAADPSTGLVLLGGNGASIYRLVRPSGSGHAAPAQSWYWEKIPWQKADIDEGDWWGGLSKHGYPHFGSALGHLAINPADPQNWTLTDWYAIYQTRDAGKSWQLTIDGIEMIVAHTVLQDPNDPQLIHAGVADIGYLSSRDGGLSFQPVHNAGISNNIKAISPAPAKPGRLYALGPREADWYANQIFISDDYGKSWSRSPMTGLPAMADGQYRSHSIAASPLNPDEVWITLSGRTGDGAGGIYYSTDAGQSWQQRSGGLPQGAPLFRHEIWVAGPELAIGQAGTLMASSNDTGRVFRLDQASGKWLELPEDAFDIDYVADEAGINALFADPQIPHRFYLCRKEGGLWRTDDSGKTFHRLTQLNTHTLALDPANPQRIAINGTEGIHYSNDGGATWRKTDDALPYRHSRNLISFSAGRLVCATGGNGIFVSAPLDEN